MPSKPPKGENTESQASTHGRRRIGLPVLVLVFAVLFVGLYQVVKPRSAEEPAKPPVNLNDKVDAKKEPSRPVDGVGTVGRQAEPPTKAEPVLIELKGQIGREEDRAVVLHDGGLALQTQGDLEGAVREFDKVVEIYARLVKQRGTTGLANDLAATLNNRGLALYSQSKFDDAVRDYDKAIEIYTRLVEDAGRTELREYVVNALGNRGLALKDQGMSLEAIDDLTRAVELLEALVSEGRTELEEKLQGARQILDGLKNESAGE